MQEFVNPARRKEQWSFSFSSSFLLRDDAIVPYFGFTSSRHRKVHPNSPSPTRVTPTLA